MTNWESFEFNAVAFNDTGVNMIQLFSFSSGSDLNVFCLNFSNKKNKERYCGMSHLQLCIMSIDGYISDCKLAMCASCFDEIKKNMIYHLCSRHNGERNRSDATSFDKCESCCHHSLRDMCVQTDGAWWKLKKYCHRKDIDIYPSGSIICLKSLSTG